MIRVERAGRLVVITFGPDKHDVLTMAPVKITLSEKEAKELAGKLEAARGEDASRRRAQQRREEEDGVWTAKQTTAAPQRART